MPTLIKELPTKELLETKFYEKDGFIYWKPHKISRGRDSERPHRRVNSYKDNSGYWKVVIFQEVYMLSRVVYQIHFGDLTPEFEIDHEDKDINNNLISNLRKVEQDVNKRNRPRPKNTPEGQEVGVQLCKKKHPPPYQNKISEYYVARWYDKNGKLVGKAFSISKLGKEEAYAQALEYRKAMIAKRNEEGAGYHETHGMERPVNNEENHKLEECYCC